MARKKKEPQVVIEDDKALSGYEKPPWDSLLPFPLVAAMWWAGYWRRVWSPWRYWPH